MVAVDWKLPAPPPAVEEKAQAGWRSPGASAPRRAGWLRVLERSCPKEGQSPPLLPEAHPLFPCAPAPTRAVATSAPITTNAVLFMAAGLLGSGSPEASTMGDP